MPSSFWVTATSTDVRGVLRTLASSWRGCGCRPLAAPAGHVAVLVGSTAKMGVGTNVQARAIALHHMDCPWRPADIEQRGGRIVRQGNQNAEIGLYRYVVERSFDSYMWQTVERKAKFISQIMRGRLDMREIEDIGDVALGAAETKALSSGNPLLMEQSVANNDVSRLQRFERAWQRNQTNLVSIRVNASSQVGVLDRDIDLLTAALPRVVDTSDDLFRMTVAGRQYSKPADAGIAIGEWAAQRGAIPAHQYRSEAGGVGPGRRVPDRRGLRHVAGSGAYRGGATRCAGGERERAAEPVRRGGGGSRAAA